MNPVRFNNMDGWKVRVTAMDSAAAAAAAAAGKSPSKESSCWQLSGALALHYCRLHIG